MKMSELYTTDLVIDAETIPEKIAEIKKNVNILSTKEDSIISE